MTDCHNLTHIILVSQERFHDMLQFRSCTDRAMCGVPVYKLDLVVMVLPYAVNRFTDMEWSTDLMHCLPYSLM